MVQEVDGLGSVKGGGVRTHNLVGKESEGRDRPGGSRSSPVTRQVRIV